MAAQFEVKKRQPFPGKKHAHYFARKVGGSIGWIEIPAARFKALVKEGAAEVTE